MSQQGMRTFSTEFKQTAVLRLEAGERIVSVAEELKIRRKLLYGAHHKTGAPRGVVGYDRADDRSRERVASTDAPISQTKEIRRRERFSPTALCPIACFVTRRTSRGPRGRRDRRRPARGNLHSHRYARRISGRSSRARAAWSRGPAVRRPAPPCCSNRRACPGPRPWRYRSRARIDRAAPGRWSRCAPSTRRGDSRIRGQAPP